MPAEKGDGKFTRLGVFPNQFADFSGTAQAVRYANSSLNPATMVVNAQVDAGPFITNDLTNSLSPISAERREPSGMQTRGPATTVLNADVVAEQSFGHGIKTCNLLYGSVAALV